MIKREPSLALTVEEALELVVAGADVVSGADQSRFMPLWGASSPPQWWRQPDRSRPLSNFPETLNHL